MKFFITLYFSGEFSDTATLPEVVIERIGHGKIVQSDRLHAYPDIF